MSRLGAVILAAALALMSVLAPAQAITLDNYRKWRAVNRPLKATGRSILEIHLGGVYSGLAWANRFNERSGGTPLFCPPKDLAPSGKLMRELVDSEIDTPSDKSVRAYTGTTSIEFLLLTAARRRWPCTGH